MSDRIKGSALTMGGAACWGVSGCMGQYLFTREGMDSTWLVPIRLFLAGLILCGFFFIKDRKTLFDPWNVRKNPRNAIDLLVYGLAGVSCCQFTYFLTIQLSSAGMGTILQDVSPVIILLVVCIQQKRGPRVFEIFSIVLALVGVFLITTHGSLTGLAVSPAALVSGIVSACCVAIYTMWPKKLQEQYPTPMLQGWAFLMGGIMFSLIFRPWQIDYVRRRWARSASSRWLYWAMCWRSACTCRVCRSSARRRPVSTALPSRSRRPSSARWCWARPLRCGMRWASAVSF